MRTFHTGPVTAAHRRFHGADYDYFSATVANEHTGRPVLARAPPGGHAVPAG